MIAPCKAPHFKLPKNGQLWGEGVVVPCSPCRLLYNVASLNAVGDLQLASKELADMQQADGSCWREGKKRGGTFSGDESTLAKGL